MPTKVQTHGNDQSSSGQRSTKPAIDNSKIQMQQQTHPTTLSERARLDPRALSPRDALQLQRVIGNQAAGRLLAQTAKRQPVQKEDWVGMATQASSTRAAETPRPNHIGLPDGLKSGLESLSGIAMDGVNVHYDSSQPDQLNALAYTQGRDIHVAPGQARHLPHEAWHVVQQAQGRVKPTMQMQEGVPVNDDEGLEHEADVMGARAAAGATQVEVMRDGLHRLNGVADPGPMATLQKIVVQLLPRPVVIDAKLANIVSDLYKGENSIPKIGDGSTADAIRNETATNRKTRGKWHSEKGRQYERALTNWYDNNPAAAKADIDAAIAILDDLDDALEHSPR